MQRIELPPGAIDVREDLLPAIRDLLSRGLSKDVLKSCVRIGAFDELVGGFKADLVAGLRVDIAAVIKVGDKSELNLHRRLIDAVNTVHPPRIFPLVIEVAFLRRNKALLIMEHLGNHATLLETVYKKDISAEHLRRICVKVVSHLRTIAQIGDKKLRRLQRTQNKGTVADRLESKFEELLRIDDKLRPLLCKPGAVSNVYCRPIGRILQKAHNFLGPSLLKPELQHGDPHLGNIMIRKYFRRGYGVKLIDPNPRVGFADPMYDIGKLYHWAEPVGWAVAQPDVCHCDWKFNTRSWSLSPATINLNRQAERQRRVLLRCIDEEITPLIHAGHLANARRHLAIAAAHIGLAARMRHPAQTTLRRFVLAHTILHLSQWDAMVP